MLREWVRPSFRALARYWKPFVLIQVGALVTVVCYFLIPAFAAVCASLAQWRTAWGVGGAAISGAVAGGILPEVAKLVSRTDPRSPRRLAYDLSFGAAFFAFSAALVHYFYAWQALFWGEGTDIATVAKKVAFDQFVFSVLWATPFGLVMFTLKKHGLSLARALPDLHPGALLRRAGPMLIPLWAFWIPMTSMIYALPGALQFVLFALALGAWSLLVTFIATDG
jgi:hypothetical protein